jgi:hypothetical protein
MPPLHGCSRVSGRFSINGRRNGNRPIIHNIINNRHPPAPGPQPGPGPAPGPAPGRAPAEWDWAAKGAVNTPMQQGACG